jgi:signal transduction histidine kinase
MKIRHLAALALLIILPLAAALFLGLHTMQRSGSERDLVRTELLTGRLARLAARCQALESTWANGLRELAGPSAALAGRNGVAALAAAPAGQEWLRQLSANAALIRQAFILDRQGRLLWPASQGASLMEQAFLERSHTFLANGWLPPQAEKGGWSESGGWYRWYWQDGLQLVFWLPWPDGFLCFELNRSALLAQLSAGLDNPLGPGDAPAANRVELRDEQGRVFLAWGAGSWTGSSARLALDGILDGWELVWRLDPAQAGDDRSADLALVFSLLALCLAALVLAAYFLRGWRRDLREAGQRVSFVNQVSHELKTPLTNIRLYAELLETRLDPAQAEAREYAAIIQREGRRLGRLIHNVLSFARQERNGQADPVHPRPESPDACVNACLESFAISFREKGLALETDLACPEARSIDPDVLDQILGNLLSNAEKYAQSGGRVRVATRPAVSAAKGAGNGLSGFELEVRDWGPGLPPAAGKRVFGAFERFHTALTDGVGGTGLGLYLVRQLARQHGGEARWEAAGPGARFIVFLADGGRPAKGGQS